MLVGAGDDIVLRNSRVSDRRFRLRISRFNAQGIDGLNIHFDPLNWLMGGLGFEMLRYADDMVVMCRSEEEAKAALEKLREWMAGAGLTLHPDKTHTVDMTVADSHFDFLGYRFQRSRQGKMMRLVRPQNPGDSCAAA